MRRWLSLCLTIAFLVPMPSAVHAADDGGGGSVPVSKRCVAGRQTEDPMSPPCVPFYDGDNGGATSPGVTADEIRVLLYLDIGCYNRECPPNDDRRVVLDLDRPPRPSCPQSYPVAASDCDFLPIRVAQAYAKYFNDRFQTYRRQVHFFMYLSDAGDEEGRRQDADRLVDAVEPFAVLNQTVFNGHQDAFDDAMADRGVMVFDGSRMALSSLQREHDPLMWSFWPDVEHAADLYTSYVCEKVAPYPVRRFGNPPGNGAPNGQERKFGLYFTSDPSRPDLLHFRDLVKDGLRDCGVSWEAEASFPEAGWMLNASDTDLYPLDAVRAFQVSGVTTVLWLGGLETRFTKHAGLLGYRPEIVFAGDFELDANVPSRAQDQTVWRNAWGVQLNLRMGDPGDSYAYQAYREGHPSGKGDEARYAEQVYRDYFLLFTGIQLAGPLLTPEAVRDGFRSIPEHTSIDPYSAACFFEDGDHSCIKDAAEVWWDPGAGCMRMVRDGRRFLAGAWAGGDDVFRNPADPCTWFEGSGSIKVL